jgi:hypothetical protein
MLYNIVTGHGVPASSQKDIIYLCFKLNELATDDFEWCFTDGNAAKAITRFFRRLDNIENKVDWRSINSTDFRDANADGDEDRVRKKHAEFLVKGHVPVVYINHIAVLNNTIKNQVEAILERFDLSIDVVIKPTYYFLWNT